MARSCGTGRPGEAQKIVQDSPGAIAAAPGHLAEAELGGHGLRGARRHPERGGDHSRRRRSGRASINSTKAGSFELERRPVSFQLLSLSSQRSWSFMPASAPPVIASRNAARRMAWSGDRRFFARDAAQGKIHTRQMRPRFLPRPAAPPKPAAGRARPAGRAAVLSPRRPTGGAGGQNGRIGLRFRGGAPPCSSLSPSSPSRS